MVAVANDRHIIRNCKNRLIPYLLKVQISVLPCGFFHMTTKLDLVAVFRSAQLEWISILQPVVRYFYLESIDDLLLKHTITITNSTSICGIAQGSKRIHKTCCQPAKSTISKSRIRLLVFNDTQIQSNLFKCFFYFPISPQINQIISQCPAHQKLHGHIIQYLRVIFFNDLLCCHPFIHDNILDSQ